jgi:ABC-type transport system involved in cytochrome c biogenesis permease component
MLVSLLLLPLLLPLLITPGWDKQLAEGCHAGAHILVHSCRLLGA